MKLIVFILYSILIAIESSKCPEPRKPHSTSCIVFYNCVNLPGGGYVWVPSKCTEGLIFQPYLRMCVLPGDTWTCDTLSTESSLITNPYDLPDYINSNETSYTGLTDDPWNFSEPIDSSYTTDSIPDDSEEIVTPYPLIEIMESNESNMKESDKKSHYTMLNRLIHQLLVYKEITIPLELLASSSSFSTPSRPISNLPLYNYLIQNYIQQNNNLQNTIITSEKLKSATNSDTTVKEDDTSEPETNMESPNEALTLDDIQSENNIILIIDNMGNKQYLTVEKYKLLGYHLDPQFVHIIPCIKNIRMPNATDCFKYFVCEPEMAVVVDYSCPLFTAFNKYSKTCDAETYKKCKQNLDSINNIDTIQTNIPSKSICMEHGKMKDPTSEMRYYICYSDNSQDIKSLRMTCPKDLIFCQTKKVCTTRRLCRP